MPMMLVTPFEPAVARTNPPSRFDFHAAKVAANRSSTGDIEFHVHWTRIHATGICASVRRSEREFWREVGAQHMPLTQVFFESFLRDGPEKCMFRFEGQFDEEGKRFADCPQPAAMTHETGLTAAAPVPE